MVLAGAGCRLPVSHDQRSAGAVSSAVLGTRFARVTTSRLETGDPVLDELDDFITAVGFDFNVPASEVVDMQLYFGNREAAGESVDALREQLTDDIEAVWQYVEAHPADDAETGGMDKTGLS